MLLLQVRRNLVLWQSRKSRNCHKTSELESKPIFRLVGRLEEDECSQNGPTISCSSNNLVGPLKNAKWVHARPVVTLVGKLDNFG